MGQLHLLSLLSLTSAIFGARCPIQSSTNVVIYVGSGATSDCQDWENKFWSWWKSGDSGINFLTLSAANVASDCTLTDFSNLKVYTQPGGNAYDQQNALKSSGKKNILNYINAGKGAYLGTCAGWFFASEGYWWQGTKYNWNNLLGKFPTTEGSITNIWDDDKPPGYTITDVDGHQGRMQALYFGGPTRGWKNTPKTWPGTTLLTFANIPNSLPAAVQDGNMLLFSVHLEAYRGHPSSNITDAQVLKNYQFRAEAINNVAGTSWKIPSSL